MRTKIVYALTSTEEDNYLEQSLISVFSLRKIMSNVAVELIVDSMTDSTINGSRSEILKFIDRKTVINAPKEYNKVQTSRYLKTNLRKFVEGDFLFIDSDTIITDTLEEIDDFDGDLGAVLNLHVPLQFHTKMDEVKVRNRICQTGYHIESNIPYFNSGVIFVRDSEEARTFYEKWYTRWQIGLNKSKLTKDQPAMAAANAEMDYVIKEIGGEWNCQVLNNGLPYLYKAKIIHYFASFAHKKNDKPYLFLDDDIYKEIKEKGCITEHIASMIDKAKGAFRKPCQVVVGNELNLLYNSMHSLAMNHPILYNSLDKSIGKMFQLWRKK